MDVEGEMERDLADIIAWMLRTALGIVSISIKIKGVEAVVMYQWCWK